MALSEPQPSLLTKRELEDVLKRVAQEQSEHHTRLRTGLAGVFSFLFPGLGHLFLGRYVWALIYIGVYVGVGYFSIKEWLSPAVLWAAAGSRNGWILLPVIWIAGICHALYEGRYGD